MKLIALKSYRTGYLGFLEEPDQYVFFSYSRHGAIKRVRSYDKADFFNCDHFLSVITKFVTRSFFLKEGVELDTFTVKGLDQISRERHEERITMKRKEKAGFGKVKAGPSGEAINPRIVEALQSKANESGLGCAAAFAVATEIGVSPKVVGEAMDQLQIPIIKCQLGLFGYSPKKKIVEQASTVTAGEEEALRQALVNGKLPCATCWQLAAKFGKTRLEMASICERLAVKISPCQLGAF